MFINAFKIIIKHIVVYTSGTDYFVLQVKGDQQLDILQPCCGIVKHEHQVAYFLLPYVVTHVLLDGSDEDRDEVLPSLLTQRSIF